MIALRDCAVDAYFLAAGVFEFYYKGNNWDFPVTPQDADKPGTKTNSNKKSSTYGQKNKFAKSGNIQVPDWFQKKYTQ